MKEERICKLFYIFIIGSVLGWGIEGLYTLLKKGLLINHSALVIGPFNIIYGLGSCVLTALLLKNKDSSYIKLFIIGFVGGTLLEYISSLAMELMLGFTAWDYSHKFLNINGRVAIVYSIYWGILGIAWIKFCYPVISKVIDRMDYSFGKKLMVGLIIFLLFDIGLTFSAIDRAREKDLGIPPSNGYERFLDKTFNWDYLKNMFNNNWELKNKNSK